MDKNKKKKLPTPRDLMKYEIAEELGLTDKINRSGWGGLTSQESGRIGGILAKREKNNAQQQSEKKE